MTVVKYMMRRRGRPSPTWRSFLRNEATGIAAIDMFVVSSATFRLLFVVLFLTHDRRKIVRFDVARHPPAGWLSRQVTGSGWFGQPGKLFRGRTVLNFGRLAESPICMALCQAEPIQHPVDRVARYAQ